MDPYERVRDERAAVHLKAACGVAVCLFTALVPYDLWMLPEPANVASATHNVIVIAAALALGVALHRDTVTPRHAHAAGFGLAALIAADIAYTLVLTGDSIYLFFQALLLLGIGMVVSRVGWAAATLVAASAIGMVGYALTWPLDQSFVQVAFALLAVALMSVALVVGRTWYLDRITELALRDRKRQAKLEEALEKAREAERRLDAKVSRRTSELRWANEALRQTIEERQQATSEKEALNEQLRHVQRVESVGQLTGGVAHDFNNLITAVIGNVEMAMMDLDADGAPYQALRDARRAATRAGELTQQLLGFARADAPGRSVDIHDAFYGLTRVVGSLLGENIALHVHSCAEGFRVAIPPVQLDQVMLNLVMNARDAMPDGGTIDLRAYGDGNDVVIEVRDTGHGMDEATLARVFEPFFTTKGPAKGTGLGLSTVRSIVSSHGGRVDVSSVPGTGTTFRLSLPLADVELASRRSSIPPRRVPRGRGERVLIVEDEEAVRRIAVRMLKRLGYRTLDAPNGPEALRLLAGETVDLLWTDVLMPGMDGKELADIVRSTHPDLPVLFASGYSGDVLAPRGVLTGHTNFLSKPYDAAEVAKAIRNALDPSPDQAEAS